MSSWVVKCKLLWLSQSCCCSEHHEVDCRHMCLVRLVMLDDFKLVMWLSERFSNLFWRAPRSFSNLSLRWEKKVKRSFSQLKVSTTASANYVYFKFSHHGCSSSAATTRSRLQVSNKINVKHHVLKTHQGERTCTEVYEDSFILKASSLGCRLRSLLVCVGLILKGQTTSLHLLFFADSWCIWWQMATIHFPSKNLIRRKACLTQWATAVCQRSSLFDQAWWWMFNWNNICVDCVRSDCRNEKDAMRHPCGRAEQIWWRFIRFACCLQSWTSADFSVPL